MQTERDAQIVGWIGALGAAGADHVMVRFVVSRSWAYRRLSVLVRDGLLVRHRVLHGRPGLYVATRAGLRWRGLGGLGVFHVAPGAFEHAWRVADVAVELACGLPGWQILSDREIRCYERELGGLLASVRVGSRGGGVAALHRPDLALVSPAGRMVAVEVELSVKARSRLLAICRGWARARHVERVYYLASKPAVGALDRAVRETRSEDRVRVFPVEQTSALLELEMGRERG